MSTAAKRALHQALQQGSFAPVYYFHGDEDLLKEKAIRQLLDRAVDPATREFNLEVRRGAELDGETLASLLATPPMMAALRVLVIRDVTALRKDARLALDRYLAAPADDAVVVLVSAAGARPDRALQTRATSIEFASLPSERVPRWIVQHAATELGATITLEAAELLQRVVGDDLPALASELDKLASYTGGAAIGEAAVAAVVGARHGETLNDLVDRVLARDGAGALGLLPRILMQPKTTAVWVVMTLTIQLLAVAWARAMSDAGASPSRIEREMIELFATKAWPWPGRPYREAATTSVQAADRWSLPTIEQALDALLAADIALKESRLSSDEQLLSSLLLALCCGEASSAAA